MNFLITGATGFIGSALCSRLLDEKHNITILTRRPDAIKAPIKSVSDLKQLREDDAFDVVINLAGEPIANRRWSDLQKQRILSSRIETTQNLITHLKKTKHKPGLLISGSAIGYYGIGKTNDIIDEKADGDDSFSSQLCRQWEAAAMQAETLGIRTCLLRTGIVLGKNGGALSKMLLPFKAGLGGKIGNGRQWMPWVHLDDLIGIILFCIDNDIIKGAVNGTSPSPVTNEEFTKKLGKALKRPTVFPMPEIIVKLLMGQMGEELLLSGKRVLPEKVLDAGYIFRHKKLEDALINLI